MRTIPLTQNQVTMVDDKNFDFLNQWGWYAVKEKYTYYAERSVFIDGKLKHLRMHNVIMNPPNGMLTDHHDHNGLNNQEYNLRNCTVPQNQMNRIPHGKSKFKGVSFYKNYNQWRVQIRINGIKKHIGYYDSEIDAAKAYDEYAVKYHKEFAYLNFK